MKLSDLTIKSITQYVSGDNDLTPYSTGPEIIELFNQVGIRDIYDGGMPEGQSRNPYTFEKLKEINGTNELIKLLQIVFDSRSFSKDTSLDRLIAIEAINTLLVHDGFRLEDFEGAVKVIGADLPDEIEVEVHFEEIQGQIIEQIRNSQFSIWVAVAWFTDRTLMKELYEKSKEGVNVRLIVLDDEINRDYGFEYEKVFETKRAKPKGAYNNIMHNKFCVIDLKTVIHGSYNWTNKARWNKETITVEHSRDLAEKFASQFTKLMTAD